MNMAMKGLTALFLGFAVAFGVQAKEDAPDSIPGTTKVSAEDIIDLVQTKSDLVIIDSRKRSDRDAGYIEGSVWLVNTDTTPDSLAQHLSSKATPVVFYCNGVKCNRSGEAAEVAVKAGYSNVYWFRGGWDEWTGKGYPTVQ